MTPTTVEFYFDPVSPYAWLAMEKIDKIIEAGGHIRCRLVLLAALLDANATKGPAEVPAKRAYAFRDVMHQSKRLDLPFRGPPSHPFNPLAVLRAICSIEGDAERLTLARHLLAAVWRDGVDVTDPDSLSSVLVGAGFNAESVRTALATPEIKLRLRNVTQEALDAGVFGVPPFRLHGELFWGADRVDALVWALKGGAIDGDFYKSVLARPVAAKR